MAPYDKGASSRADHKTRHENGTPASRSPKHRGYRAEDSSAPRQKQRWNADERRSRQQSGEGRSERPNWEPRSADQGRGRGRFERDDRRSGGRDDRGPRNFDRNDRGDRGGRSFDRDDRAPRRDFGDRDNRGPRSFDRNDRGPRNFDRNDRGDRGGRSFDRDDRGPRRDFGDRDNRGPRRDFGDRDNRGPRSFDRNAPYSHGRDTASRRPGTGEQGPSGPRNFDRGDRGGRSFDRDDRGPRRDFGDRDNRGPRSFDRNDRGPRRDFGDRDNRGPRTFDRDSRPQRNHENDWRSEREERAPFQPVDDVKLEKLQAEATVAADVEGVSFTDLGIGGNISRVLAEMGASSPFAIQAATIPDVLAGKDVLGRGRTGSGKTIAFGAPLVEKLMEHGGGKNRKMGRNPRALILAPTRELALQIDRTVQPIARAVGLFTTQIYGGVPQGRQVGALQRGVDIIVGTPGRIEDLMRQGRLDLSEVVITVLDEADHMCDLGFLEPVQRILEATADVTPQGERAQKLLFSATLDTQVAALVDQFLVEPAVHEVLGEDQASSTIDHRVLVVEQRDKDRLLEELVAGEGKTVVFARTRAYAERLADQFEDAGIRATSLHGDLNQSRRTRNLSLLTSGRVNVLVATDVAARGIHVDDVSLVIQADAPDDYKTYMHRSGRTGRAGKEGTVVTIVPRNRRRKIEGILERAEIEADLVPAAPGDALVEELAAR
jgi:superfamily II DNA/RNA helicase